MSDNPLLLAMEGDTARITLNRPDVRNALSIELSDRLVDAIRTIRKSTKIKFVVIKGAGHMMMTEKPDELLAALTAA